MKRYTHNKQNVQQKLKPQITTTRQEKKNKISFEQRILPLLRF